jgi:adenine-specific DNA-methyltransferase
VEAAQALPEAVTTTLKSRTSEKQDAIQKEITDRNLKFFAAETDKLDGWADDLKLGLEREIKELEREIKEARRAAISALTLEEKLAAQKQIRALESQRNDKRRALFDAQDAVDKQRDTLIAQIEGKLSQQVTTQPVFLLRWSLQ